MSFLNEFESRIGAVFGEAPQGYTEPFSFKKLAKRAAKEMENETYEIDGVDTAPALYTVLVSSSDDSLMRPLYQKITLETAAFVAAEAQKKGYQFVGEPLVRFMVDPSLKSGKFAVFAENIDANALADLRAEEMAFLGASSSMGGAAAAPKASRRPSAQQAPAAQPVAQPVQQPVAAQPVAAAQPVQQAPVAAQPVAAQQPSAGTARDRVRGPREDELFAAPVSAVADAAPAAAAPAAAGAANVAAGIGAAAFASRAVSSVPSADLEPLSSSASAGLNVMPSTYDYADPMPVAASGESTPMPVVGSAFAGAAAAPAAIPVPTTQRRATPLVDLRRGVGAGAAANVAAGVAAGSSPEVAASVAAQANVAAQQAQSVQQAQANADAYADPDPYGVGLGGAYAQQPAATCLLIDRQTGRTFTGTAPTTVIGRERSQCGIVLRDPNISRRHAELRWDGRDWHIVDLRSTNGTLVNDVDVDECALRDGDLLTLGLVNLEFRETK